jgi:general secretion pathway protein B
MSYILEALKKAQAERQLGNAPTIHAAQPVVAAPPDAAASRKPLFVGLGAGALVVVAGALFLWRAAPAPAPVAAPRVAVVAPPVPASPRAGRAPPPPPRPSPPRVVDAAPAAPSVAPAAPAPAPAPVQGRMPVPAMVAGAAPARAASPTPVPAPAPASAAAPAAAPEDSLPYLQQLPEQVQREVPRVAFGGYMYSANPADRLLLIDKALRHEGEEVAPGLVLEKLLPRAAVMNYRGVRYRVAY